MAEYIEREAAKNVLRKRYRIKTHCHDMESAAQLKLSELEIGDIPATDVRPVVLCRDCQNSYEWANVDGDNYRYCGYLRSRWNHDADRMVDDDDFCKWGRKRGES